MIMLPKNWNEFVKHCGHPNSCEECPDLEECVNRRNKLIKEEVENKEKNNYEIQTL